MSPLIDQSKLTLALGVLAVIALLVAAVVIQTLRLNTAQDEHAAYVAQVEAAGKVAEAERKAKAEHDRKQKEIADAENARKLAGLHATVERLRTQRANRSFLPAAPAGARDPETACFDRPLLERAIRDFDRGVSQLVDEGSEAVVHLNTARRWAQHEPHHQGAEHGSNSPDH